MPFLPLPGTSRWVLPVGVSVVAEAGFEDAAAVFEDEEPVATWYEGGGSAGRSVFPDMLVALAIVRGSSAGKMQVKAGGSAGLYLFARNKESLKGNGGFEKVLRAQQGE